MSKVDRFLDVARTAAEVCAEKNLSYGDSFSRTGEFLAILFPNGIPPEKFKDALTIVRVFDKLMRIAHRPDAFSESPWKDILGYAILAVEAESKPEV